MKINNNFTPAFKHKVIVDIGASNPRGTCKVRVTSNDGKQEFYKEDTFLNIKSDGFKNAVNLDGNGMDKGQGTFIRRLHRIIQRASDAVIEKIDNLAFIELKTKWKDIGCKSFWD